MARRVLEDTLTRKRLIARQYRQVEDFRFEACRKRLSVILDGIGVLA
jgi:hypothetical protein